MSALQEARLLLEILKRQEKREVYAARKGICAGMHMGHNKTEMFRAVDGKVRYEKIGWPRNSRGSRSYFDLPPDLEKEVMDFLNEL